jgi:choline dehydrogenase-like flavoprotein
VNFRSNIAKAFIAAGKELGFDQVNYNSLNQQGFSYVQTMIEDGKRQSTSSAYLDPLMQYGLRKNLHILKNSVVTKLLFDDDNDRVTGLVYKNLEFSYTVYVKREVILAAGAIRTPQILMLSGIGPAKHLEKLGIRVVKDLAVGENLVDHVGAGALTFFSNSTVFDLQSAFKYESLKKFDKTNEGPLASPGGVEALAFLDSKSSYNFDYPDYELLLTSGSLLSQPMLKENYNLDKNIVDKWLEKAQSKKSGAFTITPILLHPKSRGNVLLRSTNPSDSPIVNPNYFSEASDIKILIEAIKKALQLVQTKAFRKIGAEFYSEPLAQCAHHSFYSDNYWECYVRHFTFSQYRHSSTAKMGPSKDSKAVVDARL